MIDETHDWITPDGNLPIEKLHGGKLVLSGKTVHEIWAQTNVGYASKGHSRVGAGAQRARLPAPALQWPQSDFSDLLPGPFLRHAFRRAERDDLRHSLATAQAGRG